MTITSGTRCLLDTNVLIYQAVENNPFFEKAKGFFKKAFESDLKLVLSTQNFLEYSSVMTQYYKLDRESIAKDLIHFSQDSGFEIIYPLPSVVSTFSKLLGSSTMVHPSDLFLVAIAIENGVEYIITGDRDLEKIKGIKVYNPFLTD